MLPEELQSNREKRRSWRALTLWVGAIEVLVVLGLFCWRWALPAARARVVVARCHADAKEDYRKAVRELGGPEEAAGKLGLYFSLPGRLAPHRLTAARMLDACEEHALVLLMRLRQDPDWEVRLAVVNAMEDIEDPRLVWPLIGSLRDGADLVCAQAARALGARGDRRAIGPLIELLSDRDRPIPLIAAARALGELKARSAIEPLKRLLDHEEYHLRGAVRAALKRMGVEVPEGDPLRFRGSAP